MDKYSGLAYVYDQIMDHVPYDAWVEDLEKIFSKYDKKPVRILDCACGTGAMTNRLAKKNYVMTGVDLSEEMLVHAQENALDQELKVRYLLMDMRQIAIKDKFDAVISYFDGVNYLMTPSDLKSFFKSVQNVLKPGGFFVFDISTSYKMQHVLGKNTFAESHEDIAFIWENEYDPLGKTLQFDMTLFLESEDELFERHFESHHLKAYEKEEILTCVPEGFKCLEVLDGDTLNDLHTTSERALFILQAL
ncbi:class I SAM-dependent DNA methyltransferase [Fusibacter sp. JL216-2]|uniref:class I SAM-dependent DNA methyltransferase n=1 Tax=Fusibacter sp. JL216-2 TaxID=3071453 RepID=UPI003D353B51